MRPFTSLVFILLLCALIPFGIQGCGPANQNIDLSDQVDDHPADGIGHYVYALTLPTTVAAGKTLPLAMEWRTVGPVDPTSRYELDILLDGPARKVYQYLPSNNTIGEYHLSNWQTYRLDVPADFPAGTYAVAVAISQPDGTPVPLGFKQSLKYDQDFYRIATIEVGQSATEGQ